MKNKGFTLVELLAVIVVLAIISIITIPMIGNVIDESKKKALEVSANGLVEATNYFTISNDGVYEFVFDENKKGETIKGEKLDYKGSIEGTGKLYIDEEGDISLCLVDDKYYVYKNYNSGIYVGEVKDNSCIIGYDVLTNKYVAMLDDGTGQISNVYSKDEVNNLIDSVSMNVTNNTNEISNIKGTIETLQSNLSNYALQSSLNTTNDNLNSLSSIVSSHTNNINSLQTSIGNINSDLKENTTIETVTFTKGSCVQSGSIVRYGHLYIANFVLKFEGLEPNTFYDVATDLPDFKSIVTLSIPNEYGGTGVATITTNQNSIRAKCTASTNYYYANFAWFA